MWPRACSENQGPHAHAMETEFLCAHTENQSHWCSVWPCVCAKKQSTHSDNQSPCVCAHNKKQSSCVNQSVCTNSQSICVCTPPEKESLLACAENERNWHSVWPSAFVLIIKTSDLLGERGCTVTWCCGRPTHIPPLEWALCHCSRPTGRGMHSMTHRNLRPGCLESQWPWICSCGSRSYPEWL